MIRLFRVHGIHCGHCVEILERSLYRTPGVRRVRIDPAGTATRPERPSQRGSHRPGRNQGCSGLGLPLTSRCGKPSSTGRELAGTGILCDIGGL